jgi:thioredoxin reductase (NADPH)
MAAPGGPGKTVQPAGSQGGSTAAQVTEETPDAQGEFPRLSEPQIAFLATMGERRPTRAGQVLVAEGSRSCDFYVILGGMVAVIEGLRTPEERLLGVHGPGRFLGELSLLRGEAVPYSITVTEPGEVLVVSARRLQELVTREPVLGGLILQTYLIRRSVLIGLGVGIRIVGSRFSADARRLREFAARNRLPHRWIDVEEEPGAEALLCRLNVPPGSTPVVVLPGRTVLLNPGPAKLAAALGMAPPVPAGATCDLVVVGAGPAGLGTAVYAASEGLVTVILDAIATGGQAGTSPRIENYLGFPAGISGAELADRAVIQARKFGAAISVPAPATGISRVDGSYQIAIADGTAVNGRMVVVATGARYRRLDVPRLADFEGVSVFYAASQAEAMNCQNDPVAVVGGGNSAGQAALFLARHASRVSLLVRSGDLAASMSRYLADRLRRSAVDVQLNTEVRELDGDGSLRQLVVEDIRSGVRRPIEARALFVFIGAVPSTDWLGGQLALDEDGFVRTGGQAGPEAAPAELSAPGRLMLETSWPGVFAVGDVRSGSAKRVASAVGEGALAVRLAHKRAGRRLA